MALLKIDPPFDSLHDDLRFQDLMRHMNFPERTKSVVPSLSESPLSHQF